MRESILHEIKITDIPGFKLGHATNTEAGTGCTAIICENGASAGVDVRGGGPASRETDLLKPVNMIQSIHCVMLSGGSAYGLAAGDGAMTFLEENGIGFETGFGPVPIVCGASLFDLVVGNPKVRPDHDMGYAACEAAFKGLPFETGNVGAGTGATVGKYLGPDRMMKSGLGTYAVKKGNLFIGAVVAVNALGDVLDYDSGKTLAGMLKSDGLSFGSTIDEMYAELEADREIYKGNTTLGCIITNAKLDKAQCTKLAAVSHNGYAKTISPVHTSADGDTIYVMAAGEVSVNPDALGALASEVMGRAVNNAVKSAAPAYGLKAARDFY